MAQSRVFRGLSVLRIGRTIVQFVGDVLLAVFDAPKPRPDHAIRAARSALEMQAAVEAETSGDDRVPRFRIGINTGRAVIGNIRSAEIRSYYVVGVAVNVASRLESSAEPGSVVIGEDTYRLSADRVVAMLLGALDLKGKDEPVPAYLLQRIIE